MDEMRIEALSAARDRAFSRMGLGGMYADDDEDGDWGAWASDHAIDAAQEEE